MTCMYKTKLHNTNDSKVKRDGEQPFSSTHNLTTNFYPPPLPILDPHTKKEPKCCDGETHPACFPIHVPDKDPFYSLFRQNCISVVRSLPGVRYGCKFG